MAANQTRIILSWMAVLPLFFGSTGLAQTVEIDGSGGTGRQARSNDGSGGTVVVDGYARRSTYARAAHPRTARASSGTAAAADPSPPAPKPAPTTSNTDNDESASDDAQTAKTGDQTVSEAAAVPADSYDSRFEESLINRGYASASYRDATYANVATVSGYATRFDDTALAGYADRRQTYRSQNDSWYGGFNSTTYCAPRYGVWYGPRWGRYRTGYEYPAWSSYTAGRYDCFPSSSWYFRSSFGCDSYRFRSRSRDCWSWGRGSTCFGTGLYSGCGNFGGITLRITF